MPNPYLELQPYGALFAGCVAGTVATFGYQVGHLLGIDWISWETRYTLGTMYPDHQVDRIQEGVRLDPGRDPDKNMVYQTP